MQRKQILSLGWSQIAGPARRRRSRGRSVHWLQVGRTQGTCVVPAAPPRRLRREGPRHRPTILAGRLYALQLAPQTAVSFAAAPGRKSASDGRRTRPGRSATRDRGRLPRLRGGCTCLDRCGRDGKLAAVEDYQDCTVRCTALRSSEFNLASASRFVLQLSGAPKAALG